MVLAREEHMAETIQEAIAIAEQNIKEAKASMDEINALTGEGWHPHMKQALSEEKAKLNAAFNKWMEGHKKLVESVNGDAT
jgi:hypothetical protein